MKNIFHIFVIFVVSFFLIDESKASIPDVMLKCEPIIWGTLDNPHRVELTIFYKLNKDSNEAMSYIFNDYEQIVKVYDIEKYVYATKDLKKLVFLDEQTSDYEVTLDRETLIRYSSGNEAQCYVLSPIRTIDEYVQEHKKLYQSLLDNEISNQLRKNKI